MDKMTFTLWERLFDILSGPVFEGRGGFAALSRVKHEYYARMMNSIPPDLDDSSADELTRLIDFFRETVTPSGSPVPPYGESPDFLGDPVFIWRAMNNTYIKNDCLWKSVRIDAGEKVFLFDFSHIGGKSANEKTFAVPGEFVPNIDGSVTARMVRSPHPPVTEEMAGILKKLGINISPAEWEKAYAKAADCQGADFYILNDSRRVLTECYGRTGRLSEKVIGAVSRLETALQRIWETPPEIVSSHTVVVADSFNRDAEGKSLLGKLMSSGGFAEQAREWEALFGYCSGGEIPPEGTLPLDTKYFPGLESEVEAYLYRDNIHPDGILIHGENARAMRFLEREYGGHIRAVYIDPPFNTGGEFDFIDAYGIGGWLAFISERIRAAAGMLSNDGNLFLHLDRNTNHYGKLLARRIFPHIEDIVWNTNSTKDVESGLYGYKSFGGVFIRQHDTIFRCFHDNPVFHKLWKPNRRESALGIGWLDLISRPLNGNPRSIADFEFYIEKYDEDGNFTRETVNVNEKIFPLGDLWNDIYSFMQSEIRVSENVGFQNQKPENLMRRIIQCSTAPGDTVLDPFAGSGTTLAAAHKLRRKWIGIEMGAYFSEFRADGHLGILGRMKNVLRGDKSFHSGGKKRYSHLSRDLNWNGGGMFRYMEIEPFEECLQRFRIE
ncbi:MAG: site-specific DNA-methyltransferase [Brevinematales bacterium]|nr:site-specific DNA-methyltransferase [Brevinematales bacterium]